MCYKICYKICLQNLWLLRIHMSDLLLKEGQSDSFRSVVCYWNVGGYIINHIEDPKCVFKTKQDKSTQEKFTDLT